jgi:uncharacterized protein
MKTLNSYLRERFGCKVYKIALSARVTCPNRDGTIGTRGCIFCSEGGSGDFASSANLSIKEQIKDARKRIEKKAPNAKYIAYFQSFTNTYGDPSYLEKIWMEAIEDEDVLVLSIGTRPDCLGEDILNLLEKINRLKPVWVELGLQTIHEKSASYIRRGYSLNVYDEAVRKLRSRGIEVITHVILGLPGESREDMHETVRYVTKSGVQGIKLQLLHVLKGTDLAIDYQNGLVPVMEMEEYVDLVTDLLKEIPEEVIVHRMTGDGPKNLLLAPLWSADKKRVLNALRASAAGKGIKL